MRPCRVMELLHLHNVAGTGGTDVVAEGVEDLGRVALITEDNYSIHTQGQDSSNDSKPWRFPERKRDQTFPLFTSGPLSRIAFILPS